MYTRLYQRQIITGNAQIALFNSMIEHFIKIHFVTPFFKHTITFVRNANCRKFEMGFMNNVYLIFLLVCSGH